LIELASYALLALPAIELGQLGPYSTVLRLDAFAH